MEKAKHFIKELGAIEDNVKSFYHKFSTHTVICIFTYNIVLHRALDWLQENVKNILSKLPLTISYAYHAGYFDAEDHADKTSNCFFWRTIDINQALFEKRLLQNLGFNVKIQKLWERKLNKYSFEIKIGNTKNTRITDFNLFKNLIPFMIHSKKNAMKC